MISFEELKKYLPYYLSSESQKVLYQDLKDFPSNLDKRIYIKLTFDSSIIYQGDGIKEMMMVNLPSSNLGKLPAMVISNTCDLDLSNVRKSDIRIVYAPIFKLDNYKKMLATKSSFKIDEINEH